MEKSNIQVKVEDKQLPERSLTSFFSLQYSSKHNLLFGTGCSTKIYSFSMKDSKLKGTILDPYKSK
jgi:hypothetical protein